VMINIIKQLDNDCILPKYLYCSEYKREYLIALRKEIDFISSAEYDLSEMPKIPVAIYVMDDILLFGEAKIYRLRYDGVRVR